jgi:hypothetical protein
MATPAIGFALLFLGSLAISFRWPIMIFATYLASFYGHPPSRWWGDSLPDLRWALSAAAGLALITAIYWYQQRSIPKPPELSQRKTDWLIGWYVLYVLWMWIQSAWAAGPVDHFEGTMFMTKYIPVMLAIVILADTPQKIRMFMLFHVCGCAYFGYLAFLQGSGGERLDGVGGPGVDDANTLGMYLATGIVMGAALLVDGPKWTRLISAICLPVILNGMILTQSRGAFLGLVIGGLVLITFVPRRVALPLWAAGGLGLLALVSLGHQEFWERIGTIDAKEQDRDFSAQSRIGIAEAQWQMFLEHPEGIGHRGTAALSALYLPDEYLTVDNSAAGGGARVRSSHSTPMTVLTEQGVVGVILYLCLFFAILRRTFYIRRLYRSGELADEVAVIMAGVVGAIATIFIAGQFADYLRAEIQAWVIALLAAAGRVYAPGKKLQQPVAASASQGAMPAGGAPSAAFNSGPAPVRER